MGGAYSLTALPQWYWLGNKHFGKAGFQRAAQSWNAADLDVDLTGKSYLITGANSGIGKSTAEALAARNATVHMLCRNAERGEEARKELVAASGNPNVHLHIVDMSDCTSVKGFARRFLDEHSTVNCLINNAGVMPHSHTVTKDGMELSFATMACGTFLLTGLLLPALTRNPADSPARVINVSSGGMYLVKMNVNNLQSQQGKYDKTWAYANAKRAQVILTEMWAERLKGQHVVVNSMHPGWAETPGLQKSMKDFATKRKDTLRSSEEGADTIVWLAAAAEAGRHSGEFFLDRQPVPTHMHWANTDSDEKDRQALWEELERLCGWTAGEVPSGEATVPVLSNLEAAPVATAAVAATAVSTGTSEASGPHDTHSVDAGDGGGGGGGGGD